MKSTTKNLIFLVDDDQICSMMAANRLSKIDNVEIKVFTTGEDMLQELELNPNLLVLDYNLNSNDINAMDGKGVMEALMRKNKNFPIILLSGQKDIGTAVDLLKFNASDYISKGEGDLDKLESSVQKILKMQELNSMVNSNTNESTKIKKKMFISCSIFILIILGIFLF